LKSTSHAAQAQRVYCRQQSLKSSTCTS
jgi:hypothetical protein